MLFGMLSLFSYHLLIMVARKLELRSVEKTLPRSYGAISKIIELSPPPQLSFKTACSEVHHLIARYVKIYFRLRHDLPDLLMVLFYLGPLALQ